MILAGIVTVFSFLSVLSFNTRGVVTGIFDGLFYGYFFVCIYSLYAMFKDEEERGLSRHGNAKV